MSCIKIKISWGFYFDFIENCRTPIQDICMSCSKIKESYRFYSRMQDKYTTQISECRKMKVSTEMGFPLKTRNFLLYCRLPERFLKDSRRAFFTWEDSRLIYKDK